MRKILCIISVALLALTACTSNDDNPATSDLGVKEKIMGKCEPTGTGPVSRRNHIEPRC